MDQIEEANVGIALATARLDNEEMVHFLPQKSAKIKRAGYMMANMIITLIETFLLNKLFAMEISIPPSEYSYTQIPQ